MNKRLYRKVSSIYFAITFSFLFSLTATAQNCTVNAGIPTTFCVGQEIKMIGNISGPTMSGSVAWSVVSQPGGANVTFANSNSLLTSGGTASVPGTYTFQLSATCGDGNLAQDNVVYTVVALPPTPTQTGTQSYTCYTGSPINLSGTSPGAGISAKWTVISGPLGNFSAENSSSTTFTPIFPPDQCSSTPIEVTINYTLTNSNGCASSVSKVYYFLRNYGLTAKAVPSSVCGTTTTLKGSCPGVGTARWTLISKPAGAANPVFENADSYITGLSGLVAGTYTFRYTISDPFGSGACATGSTDITVTVLGTSALTSPSAGPDQYFCSIPGTISLTSNTPAVGETVSWVKLSGASVTIANPSSPNTSVTGLTDAGAPYSFIYTISNGGCAGSDTVNIYKIPDLSLITKPIDICNGGFTSKNEGPIFGNYNFNGLDTVKVNITYLSGPVGATAGITLENNINNVGGNSIPGAFPASLSAGQSYAWKIFGKDLYYETPSADPYSSAYYLSNRFFLQNPGTYKFRFSYTTKCNTYETEVSANSGKVGSFFSGVNAGTDLVLGCNVTTSTLAGNLDDGDGKWITTQKPAGATDPINAINQYKKSPALSGLIPGTYVFRYSFNEGPDCIDNFPDNIKLVVSSTPPAAPNAGANKTTCAGSIRLNGSAIPSNVTALWTIVSPAGSGVTFNDATIANPLAIGLQPSTVYVFRYTFSNGCTPPASADVTITTTTNVNPQKPSISGFLADCSSGATSIPSSVFVPIFHPAFTAGGGIDSSWRIVSSPAGISYTISPSSTTQTNINFNIDKEYAISIIYKLTNSTCSAEATADTLTIAYRNENTFTVDAGSSQQLCATNSYPAMATLSGSTTTLPVLWTNNISSNGQTPTITSPNSRTTTVSIPANGSYRFRYQIQSPTDAACPNLGESYSQIITSSPGSPAIAGNDISFCNATGTTNLAATTLASGTGQWQVYDIISGTTPTISNVSSATSAINFSQSGSVVLKWNSYGTIVECGPSSSDLVTVTYYAPANAGNDQQLCKSTSANLNALSPSPATGVWTKISGSAVTIADPTNPQTVVSGLTSGTYVFRWSVTAPSSCSSTDDVNIIVSDITDVANAGIDFNSCSGGSKTIQLNATPAPSGFTGTWTITNKPTGAATGSFTNINSPTSRYNGMYMPGKYVFAWTISNGVCSSTDFVEATANATMCTLPIELSKFSATLNSNCGVALYWQSESEQNGLKFIVERSEDGFNYNSIKVIAAAGNSVVTQRYNFTDINTNADEYFYRLKMVDRDGSFKYSGIVRIAIPCAKKNSLSVLPNPAQTGKQFKLKISADKDITKGIVRIKNIAGQIVHSYPIVVRAGTTFIDYPAMSLGSGTYLIDITENNKLISTCKIVIQ